jgi:hypothetical protein
MVWVAASELLAIRQQNDQAKRFAETKIAITVREGCANSNWRSAADVVATSAGEIELLHDFAP